jgi:hypothetical protein
VRSFPFADHGELAAAVARLRWLDHESMRAIARRQWRYRLTEKIELAGVLGHDAPPQEIRSAVVGPR